MVINLAANTWNEILKIEGLHDYDMNVLNESIHRIQDLMYTRIFINEIGSL